MRCDTLIIPQVPTNVHNPVRHRVVMLVLTFVGKWKAKAAASISGLAIVDGATMYHIFDLQSAIVVGYVGVPLCHRIQKILSLVIAPLRRRFASAHYRFCAYRKRTDQLSLYVCNV